MLYLYAVLGSQPIHNQPLRIARFGKLFAAVAEVSQPPALEEGALRDHERIVRELAANVEAILPVRFGSVFTDDGGLASLLADREKEMLRALDLVAGREQMTLRVFKEQPGEKPVPATPLNDEAPASGAAYLLAKKRARDHDSMAIGLAEIHRVPRLEALIRAERCERRKEVASIFHLIDRGRSGEYSEALKQAAVSPLRFKVSGPWPPYAFGPPEVF